MSMSHRDIQNMKGVGVGVIGCIAVTGFARELYRSGNFSGVLNSLRFLSPQNSGGIWRTSQALTGLGGAYASLRYLENYMNTGSKDSDFVVGIKNATLCYTAAGGIVYFLYWTIPELFTK